MRSVARLISCAIVTLGVSVVAGRAQSERFVVPEWRGSAGSFYAGWDDFTTATGDIAPERPGSAAGFVLRQSEAAAFVTSSGNIYSFAAPLVVSIEMPVLAAAPGRVVLQVRVLATPIDSASLRLEREVEPGVWSTLPAPVGELLQAGETGSPGFGAAIDETWRWSWTWPTAAAASRLRIGFAASGSSQSLVAVAVDLAPPAALADLFSVWTETHFSSAERADETVSGAEADPDGDGLTNLLEYALGGDPRLATSAPRAHLGPAVVGAPLALSFHRIADPALGYRVEATGDLVTWTTIFVSSGSDNVAGSVIVPDVVALGLEQPRRFLRLKVERAP